MRAATWRIVGTVAVAGTSLLASPPGAHADLDGPCVATLTINESGETFDATTGDVIVIPRTVTGEWEASTELEPTDYAGWAAIDLPFPFGRLTVDTWEGAVGQSTSNSGDFDVELPSLVPSGVQFSAIGEHVTPAGACTGKVRLQIGGGLFDSNAGWIALGMLVPVLLVLGWWISQLVRAGRAGGAGRVPAGLAGVGHALLGLLAFILLAVELVLFGLLPLDSPVVGLLAVLGPVFGVIHTVLVRRRRRGASPAAA